MRRIVLMLSTLIFFGACLMGSVIAQESSVFRYASDPFSEEATEKEATPTENADGEETESAESSYDSYASWPSGGKNLVQRKAMFRTQQREQRIAARQWYGYSASRPPVFGNPYYMDAHSPSLWVTPGFSQSSLNGPFGWYFPRRSLSAYRWAPYTYYAAALVR